MSFSTVNPASGEALRTYQCMTEPEIRDIADAAGRAQKQWAALSLQERLPFFSALARVLRENKERYAALMTEEMGKPISESLAEIEKCAWLADMLVEKAPIWLADTPVVAGGSQHTLTYDPLGVLFLIMPWNYPFWQPMKVALPPMIAGNGVLLKHARSVTGSAYAVEEAFKTAGFPEHLFRVVVIEHDMTAAVLAHDAVQAGSLTGSERAGAAFAAEAGKQLKKVVLELGGSDPAIVLDDADIEKAAAGIVKGRFGNAGQVCIASKRIIVLASVADAFTRAFVEKTQALHVGDPTDAATNLGPLMNERAVEDMEAVVADAVAHGATILTGGARIDRPGYFFAPTVLGQVTPAMRAFSTEVFGPVAPIIIAKDEAEAVQLANQSPYGLAASIWSEDVSRATRIARRIEAGGVYINSPAFSDPRIPFGGIKRSGYGNELSEYGIHEFVNIKSINVL